MLRVYQGPEKGTERGSFLDAPAGGTLVCPRMGGIAGDLQVMGLADLLGWFAHRRRSGTLHLTTRSTRARVAVSDGLLDGTYSNDPRHMLGQFLIRDAAVTEQQPFEALL